MPDFIPPILLPPGVADRRNADFVATLSQLLAEFSTSALLVRDPLTVDARMLPILTVELGMSDFISPGLLEHHVRALLDRAPDIHAITGTIAGTKRALGAIGVTVDWTQWWQMVPRGQHDTHQVIAYVNENLIEGEIALLSEATQYAIRRIIEATQRWSQEISFLLGVRFKSTAGLADALQTAELASPTLNSTPPMPNIALGAVGSLETAAGLLLTVDAAMPVPKADAGLFGLLTSVQFISLSMEAAA